MRMKYYFTLVSFVVICVLLCGCNQFSPQIETHSSSVTSEPSDLEASPPDLQRFSNCSYDEYEYTFSPIKSALYYHDGIAEEVPVDDPRLYMLLNYIMYSENNSSSWVRQGYIGIDEIEDHFGNCPQLEIHFRCDGSPKDDILGDIPHIIITGATVLLFEDNDHIEQHWPYMELRRDMVKIGIVSEEEFTNEMDSDYLGTPWLDLLKISGFDYGPKT